MVFSKAGLLFSSKTAAEVLNGGASDFPDYFQYRFNARRVSATTLKQEGSK